MKILYLITLTVVILNIKGYTQSISEKTNYPTATRVKCEYQFNGGGGIYFDYWMPPTNSVVIDNSSSMVYLYLKWKNIEASAGKSMLQARYHDSQNHPIDVTTYVGPFQLSFPNPTFVGGATRNVPCHSTDPITISLNPYNNTADNGIDKDTEITSHFRWTLPPGWISSGGKTGSFDAYSSLTVIPPVSSSNTSIQVQPYADAGQGRQYGPSISIQITRNLEPFSITGPTSVVYNSTYRYTVPSYPGISYSWQLPTGWSGSSNTNYIDVTAGCGTGNIVATMTGCNGSKPSQTTVATSIIAPGTTISGSDIVCASGAQFSVLGLAPGTNITWNASTNLTLSGASSNYCIYTANSNGDGWVEATINAPACGTSVTLPRKTVWVGTPPSPDIHSNQPLTVYTEQDIVLYDNIINVSPSWVNIFNWTWYCDGVGMFDSYDYGDGEKMYIFHDEGTARIRAVSENVCGLSDLSSSVFVQVISPPSRLNLSPNPASDQTTIKIESTKKVQADKAFEWEVEVYDQIQSLKEKKTKLKTKETKINTSSWKDGIYVVRAKIGSEIITEKLLVKH